MLTLLLTHLALAIPEYAKAAAYLAKYGYLAKSDTTPDYATAAAYLAKYGYLAK